MARDRARRSRPLAVEPLEPRMLLTAGPLVITEVMYHPPEPTTAEAAAAQTTNRDDFEFIEFQNVGTEAIPLAGIAMTKGVLFTFGSMTLEAGGYVVVVKNPLAFETRYGDGLPVAGTYDNSLSNAGEELILKDAAQSVILDFTFKDGWYSETDGNGASLCIVNPHADLSTWGTKASWTPSLEHGGSPGTVNHLLDVTPPSTPQNLRATTAGASVTLQWDPAVDAESGISEYRVYRDDALLGSSATTSFTDSTVELTLDYVYRVLAVNGQATEGVKSDPLSVFVPPQGTDPAFAAGVARGTVSDSHITECSGLVASRVNPDVLWIQNDGSKPAAIHAIDTKGNFLGNFALAGLQATDCEDLAAGPGPIAGINYLYLGDIGDNSSLRGTIEVYRVAEPTVLAVGGDQSQTLSNVDVLTLQYPDGPQDAETLLCDPWTGDLYVISKTRTPNRIYRAAAASLVPGSTITMTLAGTIAFPDVCAGDISPSGTEILLRREDYAAVFVRSAGQSVADALLSTPLQTPVIGTPTEPNGEAVGYSATGLGYYTLSEGTNQPLHYFRRTSIPPSLVRVTPTSGLATTETGATASFSIVLDARPTADVTVSMVSSDTTEGTVSAASVTFTTSNWNQPQTVTVTGVDDLAVDGDVAYTVVTGVATSTDRVYSGMDVPDVSITNRDSTRKWTGATDTEWANASNWLPSALPQSSDCLLFAGSAAASTINHFPAGTTFRKIVFENGNFTVSGNSIAVPSGTGMTIEVAAGASCRFEIPLTGDAGLSLAGDGQLILTSANQYADGTMVSSGTLVIDTADALPPGSSLTIGSAGAVVLASNLNQAIELSSLVFETAATAISAEEPIAAPVLVEANAVTVIATSVVLEESTVESSFCCGKDCRVGRAERVPPETREDTDNPQQKQSSVRPEPVVLADQQCTTVSQARVDATAVYGPAKPKTNHEIPKVRNPEMNRRVADEHQAKLSRQVPPETCENTDGGTRSARPTLQAFPQQKQSSAICQPKLKKRVSLDQIFAATVDWRTL